MIHRVTQSALIAFVASLLLVASAWADTAQVTGTVQRVDVGTRTIYLTDGRAITLDPRAELRIGSRRITLADVRPGWTLAMASAPPDVSSVVVTPSPPAASAQTTAPSVITPPVAGQSTVDATGIVASVDSQARTVTLQDGRVLQLRAGTSVWQSVPLSSITPGSEVYVRTAEPLAFRATTSTVYTRQYWMGTVASVDAANSRVVLSDGTVVQLAPGGQADVQSRPVSIRDLRPGDEVVIGVPASRGPVPFAGAAGSALPRAVASGGVIQADQLHVVHRVQPTR